MKYLWSKRIVMGIVVLFLVLTGCEGTPVKIGESFTLSISFDPEGGIVKVDPEEPNYSEGSVVQLTALANDGWNFIEWKGDFEETDPQINVPITKDMEIEAVFDVNVDPVTGFAGGDGTEDDPYLLGTVEQMARLWDEEHLDGFFKQIASIDFDLITIAQNEGWQPIGDEDKPFSGTYDGNNRRIRNLSINRPGADNVGLFGYTSEEAIIKNVNLLSVNIVGGEFTGGLVGYNNGEILNCFVDGTITALEDDEESLERRVGGLVGENTGVIEGSGSEANVTGEREVGGLVGDNSFEGVITDSFAKGEINAEKNLGGLVGVNYGEVFDSFAAGKVETINYDPDENGYGAGGLVGVNYSGQYFGKNYVAKIINCYATGDVFGDEYDIGGLVGYNRGGEIRESFATGNVTGDNRIGGLVGRNSYTSYFGGIIEDCYSWGNVSGVERIGGLVGAHVYFDTVHGHPRPIIENCYSIGQVIGSGGGLIGDATSFEVYSSYWDLNTSGKEDSDFGEGRTTKQLQAGNPGDILDEDGNPDLDGDEMFEDWDSDIWDFGTSNDYPILINTP